MRQNIPDWGSGGKEGISGAPPAVTASRADGWWLSRAASSAFLPLLQVDDGEEKCLHARADMIGTANLTRVMSARGACFFAQAYSLLLLAKGTISSVGVAARMIGMPVGGVHLVETCLLLQAIEAAHAGARRRSERYPGVKRSESVTAPSFFPKMVAISRARTLSSPSHRTAARFSGWFHSTRNPRASAASGYTRVQPSARKIWYSGWVSTKGVTPRSGMSMARLSGAPMG